MSQEKFLKITYHGGQQKLNAYLKMPSPIFAVLQREISLCLFEERKLPQCELKTYWIDEDGDTIDIVNQCDYEVFMAKLPLRQHLQVAPRNTTSTPTSNVNDATNPDDPAAFVIHEHVACDACDLAPIVGFRYKCIQCPNYDLCQRCEAQHKHAEHMMVRLPSENSPNVIDAWVSGPGARSCGRRSKRDKRGACPFMPMQQRDIGTCNTGLDLTGIIGDGEPQPNADTEKHHSRHHHHERKHRRQARNGLWTNLYEIMQDFAEGGATARQEEAFVGTFARPSSNSNKPSTEARAQNAANEAANEAAAKAAEMAAKAANEAAAKAAEMAAKAANEAAAKAAEMAAKVVEQAAEISASVVQQVSAGINSAGAATTVTTNEANAASKQPEGAAAAVASEPKEQPEGAAKPEAFEENKSQQNTVDNMNPLLNAPTIEELAKLIDPKYMKAGIQILSNFSDLVAKVLDPVGDMDAGISCPYQGDGYQTHRKNSASSSSSGASNCSTMTANNSNLPTEKKEETEAQTQEQQPIDVTTTAAGNKTPSPERRRSQSEDNDWQLVDKQAANDIRVRGISSSSSAESIVQEDSNGNSKEETATESAQPRVPRPASMNFEQLSNDLREHIEQEHKREAAEAQQKKEVVAVETPQKQTETAKAATPSTSATSNNGTKPKTPEEKRTPTVYHKDDRINNAVYAMIAMGFSNEGAWLTQLLESVNGNISEALDLMSVARHNK